VPSNFGLREELNSGVMMKKGMVLGLCGVVLALLGAGLSFISDSFIGLWMVRLGVVLGWAGALVFFFFKLKK